MVIILLVLATICPAATHAAEWELIGEYGSGDIAYVDKTSIIRLTSAITKVWVKVVNNEPDLYRVSFSKELHYVNCSARTLATKQSAKYDIDGDYLRGTTVTDVLLEYDDVIPETLGETIVDYVCKQPK